MRNINYTSGSLSFKLDVLSYSESVIFKCMYWYLDEFNVSITLENNCHLVSLSLKSKEEFDEEELIVRIKNDLIDFKLREIINTETSNLRELITAKAFANYDFDIFEKKEYSISDPVGFNPNEIKHD
ncbi:His-Xaa-Ser system protein HxsD [Myroides sp. TSA_177.3]|uniref:His-Xaa-Ser system protein HxsD n=1 Tax=Myroides sp. TSA_177.3 TaxID=3415650 RepID=UPI00404602DF